MNTLRKLDNIAKAFSLDEKKYSNIFRITAELNDNIDEKMLLEALNKTLKIYPEYKVKLAKGFFWLYFIYNDREITIKKEKNKQKERLKMIDNNKYLFRVTYYNNEINLYLYHILSDGLGAQIFFKELLYNYLNVKYNLPIIDTKVKNLEVSDPSIKCRGTKLKQKNNKNRISLIDEEFNLAENKNYIYSIDITKLKKVCKEKGCTITEYIVSLYILGLYNTVYNRKNGDIVITVPVDLRRYYNIKTLSNFFTCIKINANVFKKDKVTLDTIIDNVIEQFKEKLKEDNIKNCLFKDVKLGTNMFLKYIPRYIKKSSMKYFGKILNSTTTSTVSNVGPFIVEEQYSKYINNVVYSVNAGSLQKIKCTINSYEDKLNITINSNLVNYEFEKEFYKLLIEQNLQVTFKK